MGWVKLHSGRSYVGISKHFSDDGHLVETTAVCRLSVAIEAQKLNSIQLVPPPLPSAYHRQGNLFFPVSYQSTLGTYILYVLYCCNMESLQGWNYVFVIFTLSKRGQIAVLNRLCATSVSFFMSLILFVTAFTGFPSSLMDLLGGSVRRCLRAR